MEVEWLIILSHLSDMEVKRRGTGSTARPKRLISNIVHLYRII